MVAAEKVKLDAETALKNKTAVIKEIVQKAAQISNEQGREYSWVNYTGLSSLPQGLSKHAFISMSAENLDGIFVGDHYIYLTPNVMVVGRDHTAFGDSDSPKQSSFRVERINGVRTENLPTEGEATYVGKAFNSDNVGTLNYKVNFTEKTGAVSLSQFNNVAIPTIQLEKGNIADGMIKANASAEGGISGKYELGFYGENAQAIAGETYLYKQFEKGIATNSTTAEKYEDAERGTVFGMAGEKQ
ncbi:TPA: factor H binding protein domain-containing protein [Mannheimia haemolytica]